MLEVYHHPFCPISRKLRIVLNEKKLQCEFITEKYWEHRVDFVKLNPAGQTPVIVKSCGMILSGNYPIFEYLNEVIPESNLIGENPIERMNVRKICEWFDVKFFHEVTKYIINEKFLKVYLKTGEPNSAHIRAATKNLLYHMEYIAFLLKDRDYVISGKVSLADFSIAAQLSVLDYFGDVPWEKNEKVKHWYSLIKSRPSFRPILHDRVSNFHPPHYYSDPDF